LSEHVENLMNERVSDWFTHVDDFLIVENVQEPSSEYAFVTIIANGDPIGCVIILATEEKAVTEAEFLVAETAAYFLAKQMEHYARLTSVSLAFFIVTYHSYNF